MNFDTQQNERKEEDLKSNVVQIKCEKEERTIRNVKKKILNLLSLSMSPPLFIIIISLLFLSLLPPPQIIILHLSFHFQYILFHLLKECSSLFPSSKSCFLFHLLFFLSIQDSCINSFIHSRVCQSVSQSVGLESESSLVCVY